PRQLASVATIAVSGMLFPMPATASWTTRNSPCRLPLSHALPLTEAHMLIRHEFPRPPAYSPSFDRLTLFSPAGERIAVRSCAASLWPVPGYVEVTLPAP